LAKSSFTTAYQGQEGINSLQSPSFELPSNSKRIDRRYLKKEVAYASLLLWI